MKNKKTKKPRFNTKENAEKAIWENRGFAGATPVWVSADYAKAHGVEKAGWYFYSRNLVWWAVK